MIHLIDILLGALCLIFAAVAAKKGFAAAALRFILSIVATAVSWLLAARFCQSFYDAFVRQRLLGYISKQLLPKLDAATSTMNDFLSSLPAWIVSMTEKLGIHIGDAASQSITAERIETAYFGPLALFIVKTVLFVVFSLILGILFAIIAKIIAGRIKDSAARPLDITLGAALGLLHGVLVVFVLALILYAITYAVPNSEYAKYVNASFICRIAVEILNLI
ncbi:MAG: CvpA family protein [Clostridia bacterium]|nr:CvpA family protein [Clostridia bacterium]